MEDIKKNGEYPTKHGSHNLDYLKSSGKMPKGKQADNPYVTAFWKWFPDALSAFEKYYDLQAASQQ